MDQKIAMKHSVQHMDKMLTLDDFIEAKYEKVAGKEVAEQQHHLFPMQRELLADVLYRHPELFNGEFVLYPCVLCPFGATEWAAGMFVMLKK
eukprot:7384592-Ditylum_brightwellii.AAC.1